MHKLAFMKMLNKIVQPYVYVICSLIVYQFSIFSSYIWGLENEGGGELRK
jgi:hypothetical protein